jgi:nicotinamidase-related amidase
MNDVSTDRDSLTAALAEAMPIAPSTLDLRGDGGGYGLVIVDEVNGFAAIGGGNLAPPTPNAQVATMIAETDRIARAFSARSMPILAFLDTHEPGKPEPPYPPHCEIGTGEEELVAELKWLEGDANTTLVRKDCINGYIGAIRPDGSNAVADWIKTNAITNLLVVGICTDICVMDFVLTILSARNHGLAGKVGDIMVYAQGCATYDLPRAVAEELGLGAVASHPQMPTHHMGLYFMASRGAGLVDRVDI